MVVVVNQEARTRWLAKCSVTRSRRPNSHVTHLENFPWFINFIRLSGTISWSDLKFIVHVHVQSLQTNILHVISMVTKFFSSYTCIYWTVCLKVSSIRKAHPHSIIFDELYTQRSCTESTSNCHSLLLHVHAGGLGSELSRLQASVLEILV